MANIFEVLKVTLKNFFRPTFTVMYPDKKRELPERYRGPLFALPVDESGNLKCIACRLCEQICPSKIIKVVPAKEKGPHGKPYPQEFTLDLNACLACELCVQVCPTDAILMIRIPGWAALSHDEIFLTLERMIEISKKYPVSWGSGNNLRRIQTPPRKVVTQDTKKEVR
jgi:NADH-quinone oxidoreductase chain I